MHLCHIIFAFVQKRFFNLERAFQILNQIKKSDEQIQSDLATIPEH